MTDTPSKPIDTPFPPPVSAEVFAETVGENGDDCHFPYEPEGTGDEAHFPEGYKHTGGASLS